ncbi:MAG: hypothetical protein B9S32_02445 [Verrucomicrobia bacterium Tous-C9LFEB]|nr:MAG: hypothetical protein B9S32_02445 [Verrucomicrobia bacterium Tous-C9LFEB]
MDSKGLAKCGFCLVYRLLALAALAWGLYQFAFVPYGVVNLMADRELAYSFAKAFATVSPQLVLSGTFVFLGEFALHRSPMILAFLYREE